MTDPDDKSSVVLRALIVVAAVFGLLPFLSYVDAVPLQPDSIKWIENAVPGLNANGSSWADWTFHSSHFVGYRPLTALSFTADLSLFGPSAAALRVTDLLLHALAALAVGLVALRMTGSLAAILAVLWFALHPATDEVLPFLARRSYPLAVLMAFSAFLAASAAARSCMGANASRRTLWLAGFWVGPLLLAALFSNELGGLLALALPVVLLSEKREGGSFKPIVGLTAWGWAWVALGVWIRGQVLSGDSGYEVAAQEPGRAMEVLRLYFSSLTGQLGGAAGAAAIAGLVLTAYLVAASAALAWTRRTLVPLGLVLALVAYGLVVARESVWFPRQAYPAAALAGLLLASLSSEALSGSSPSPLRLPRALHALAAASLLALLALPSPFLRGTSELRRERAQVATAFVKTLTEDLNAIDGPAEVIVVAPVPDLNKVATDTERGSLRASSGEAKVRTRALRVPVRWARLTLGEDITLRDLLYVVDPLQAHRPKLVTGRGPRGQAALALAAGVRAYGVQRKQLRELPEGQTRFDLPAVKPGDPGPGPLVWIYGGTTREVRLTAREPGDSTD